MITFIEFVQAKGKEAEWFLVEKEKWIQGLNLKKGRCAHPGDEKCPKGSPQYNLAQRFKHGDLHKKKKD